MSDLQPEIPYRLNNGLPFEFSEYDTAVPDESEAIEECSDELFAVLIEHTSPQTAKLKDGELVERRIDAARWRLYAQEHDWAVIDASHKYAADLVAECLATQRQFSQREQFGHAD